MKPQNYINSFDRTLIHYIHSPGKIGHTLVFLHGVGGNLTVWKKEMNHFKKKGYGILALDFRGHGNSEMPNDAKKYKFTNFCRDLFEVIKKEKIKDFSFISHSLGTGIATIYSRKYKSRSPSSMIFIDASTRYPYAHNKILNLNPYVVKALRYVAYHHTSDPEHFENIKEFDFSRGKMERALDILLTIFRISPVSAVIKILDNTEKFIHNKKSYIDNTIKGFSVPVLAIGSGRDKVISPKETQRIKKLYPKAKIKILPGATHEVIIDNPKEINYLIDQFLTKEVLKKKK
jgi:pimeloyl-ACP methyl ester carboxylesterase